MARACARLGPMLFVVGTMFAISLHAQTATGDIAGVVSDSQGAVIIGAQVTAVDISTGRSRVTATNEQGMFAFPLLLPDTYQITARAPLMAANVARVELLLGTHRELSFVLHPESAATTLQVAVESPLIETTSSEVQTNVNPQQMTSLPLFDRTFSSLAILAPGVRPAFGGVGPVSINGSTGRNFNLMVDGGEDKDNTMGGFLQNYTTEGIQEFAVKTYNFSAQTGKSSGAVIEIVTRSGS